MKERRGKGSRVEKVIKEERREARMKEVKKRNGREFFQRLLCNLIYVPIMSNIGSGRGCTWSAREM